MINFFVFKMRVRCNICRVKSLTLLRFSVFSMTLQVATLELHPVKGLASIHRAVVGLLSLRCHLMSSRPRLKPEDIQRQWAIACVLLPGLLSH